MRPSPTKNFLISAAMIVVAGVLEFILVKSSNPEALQLLKLIEHSLPN